MTTRLRRITANSVQNNGFTTTREARGLARSTVFARALQGEVQDINHEAQYSLATARHTKKLENDGISVLKETARERQETAQEWAAVSALDSSKPQSASLYQCARPRSGIYGHAFPDPNEYARKLQQRPRTSQTYFQMAANREKKKTSASYDVRKKVYALRQTLSQYRREYA